MPELKVVGLSNPPTPSAKKPPAAAASSYAPQADRYVRSPIDAGTLESQADELARMHRGSGSSAVSLNERSGKLDLVAEVSTRDMAPAEKVLPLRLDALRRSLHHIDEKDGWLLTRDPVFYMRDGKAHIDFVNLAGFVVDPMGHVLSRSVTPD